MLCIATRCRRVRKRAVLPSGCTHISQNNQSHAVLNIGDGSERDQRLIFLLFLSLLMVDRSESVVVSGRIRIRTNSMEDFSGAEPVSARQSSVIPQLVGRPRPQALLARCFEGYSLHGR
jgi:hypothetical protein